MWPPCSVLNCGRLIRIMQLTAIIVPLLTISPIIAVAHVYWLKFSTHLDTVTNNSLGAFWTVTSLTGWLLSIYQMGAYTMQMPTLSQDVCDVHDVPVAVCGVTGRFLQRFFRHSVTFSDIVHIVWHRSYLQSGRTAPSFSTLDQIRVPIWFGFRAHEYGWFRAAENQVGLIGYV